MGRRRGATLAISERRANEILMEETIPRRESERADTPEEDRYRKSLRTDVRRLKRAGAEVVVPTEDPDPRPGTRS